jgi:NADPH:quinone reductase
MTNKTSTKVAVRRAAEDIASCLEAGVLRPRVGMRFPLERIAEAHEEMEGGRSGGRVVVEVG